MKIKKYYLKKKYALENSKVLFYFPNVSFLKAGETRKFKRFCALKKMRLIFLPSKFKYTAYGEAHGPSMTCALSKDLGFSEMSFTKDLQSCSLSSFGRNIFYGKKEKSIDSQKKYAQTFLYLLTQTTQV